MFATWTGHPFTIATSGIAALVAGAIDALTLRRSIAKVCEPYALPRHIKIVDAIPVLSTGKYDRALAEQLLQTKVQSGNTDS